MVLSSLGTAGTAALHPEVEADAAFSTRRARSHRPDPPHAGASGMSAMACPGTPSLWLSTRPAATSSPRPDPRQVAARRADLGETCAAQGHATAAGHPSLAVGDHARQG